MVLLGTNILPLISIVIIICCIGFVIGGFFWVYNKVRELTREKLENEAEKVEYINQRFANIKWELEEGKHSYDNQRIAIDKPYRKTDNWKVTLWVDVYDKDPEDPILDAEHKSKLLLDISDSELQKLINPNKEEVKKDQNKIIDKKPETNFIADELLKLNQLKESGILTEEEFKQQKKKLF